MNDEPRGRGRPSKYDPAFAEQARKLCARGATDLELADWFETSLSAIRRWKLAHDDFASATMLGKEIADARVERALFDRAVGYSYESEKILTSNGQVFREPTVEHVPPDVRAASVWLLNRKEGFTLGQSGRRKLDLGDLHGPEGLVLAQERTLLALSEGIISPEEASRVIASIGEVGEQRERTLVAKQVEQLENNPARLTHDGEES